jgi:hypothetical protein
MYFKYPRSGRIYKCLIHRMKFLIFMFLMNLVLHNRTSVHRETNKSTIIIIYFPSTHYTILIFILYCIVGYIVRDECAIIRLFFGKCTLYAKRVALDVLVIIVFVIGPKVRWFTHRRGRWIFNCDKNPHHDFRRRGSKSLCTMS